jgi:hypothetical protein
MLRTYDLKTKINKGKKEKILSVLREYRKTASVIGKKQWELFYKEGSFNKTDVSIIYKFTSNHPLTSLLPT